MLELCHAENRSLKFSSSLTCEWLGPKFLGCLHLDQSRAVWSRAGAAAQDAITASGSLTYWSEHWPHYIAFLNQWVSALPICGILSMDYCSGLPFLTQERVECLGAKSRV